MIHDRALKSGIERFTHRIYTQGKILKLKLFGSFDFTHPQHLASLAVNMLSSKENSRKRKNDLDKIGLRPVSSFLSVVKCVVMSSSPHTPHPICLNFDFSHPPCWLTWGVNFVIAVVLIEDLTWHSLAGAAQATCRGHLPPKCHRAVSLWIPPPPLPAQLMWLSGRPMLLVAEVRGSIPAKHQGWSRR